MEQRGGRKREQKKEQALSPLISAKCKRRRSSDRCEGTQKKERGYESEGGFFVVFFAKCAVVLYARDFAMSSFLGIKRESLSERKKKV